MAEIVNVTYVGADGTEWPMQVDKNLRIKSANFHNWMYEAEGQTLEQGIMPLRFYRNAATYTTKLYFAGTVAERKISIDNMHTAFEKDVRALTPGKLIWGLYYITCYILASSTYPDMKNDVTVNDIDIWCPYPFWMKDETVELPAGTDPAGSSEFLDYEYDYEYDFTPVATATSEIENAGTAAAPFRIKFFGPAANPWVKIAGNVYQINENLEEGDTALFDGLDMTVTITSADGITRNAFNSRRKTGSEFDPIPIGTNVIEWPGTYRVIVTVMQERSEPAWS